MNVTAWVILSQGTRYSESNSLTPLKANFISLNDYWIVSFFGRDIAPVYRTLITPLYNY